MAKHPGGRPESINKDVLTKLEEAFSYGYTDDEASLYANISPRTLYRYIEEHEEFGRRKEALKRKPAMIAKRNKVAAIKEGNLQESGRRLERKSRDEFSLKTEVESKIDDGQFMITHLTDEQKRKIAERYLKLGD